MIFAAAILSGLLFLIIARRLTLEKLLETLEEELGNAIVQYLFTTDEADGD